MKQIDLNVQKPESDHLPKLYAADSINCTVVRLYFRDEDEATVVQMIKDHNLQRALWNSNPVPAALD